MREKKLNRVTLAVVVLITIAVACWALARSFWITPAGQSIHRGRPENMPRRQQGSSLRVGRSNMTGHADMPAGGIVSERDR